MLFKDIPIQKKLMRVLMVTSGAVLLLTCTSFLVYEFYSFRQTSVRELATLGEIVATNSTAAIAFDSRDDANEILAALKAEPNIIAAAIYDKDGNLFSQYPEKSSPKTYPAKPGGDGFQFGEKHLTGFQPIIQGEKRLGTLYLKSDLRAMYDRFKLYGIIALIVIVASSLVAFILSKILQRSISQPILELAKTAKEISNHRDYSVRAHKPGNDELGSLTDSFNTMLEEIHEFNQTLEQKVQDRTRELEVANKELESYSYTISHDLRAPLRSISGFANIFAEDYANQLDDEAKRMIGIIVNNSHKMGQLIDDLLSFSRLGRKELVKSTVSMKAMALNVWEELTKFEENRKIEFTLNDIPDAQADGSIIKQVWVNLISNALKYSKKKEKTVIEISAEEKPDMIIYSVRDNGAGFDMQYYNKLFGVFQRLHSATEFEGTGAGLAIVQRIISKHGGKIWAEAKVNEGAVFYFSLPKTNPLV